jgi:ubiquinone/menaquinone biosynthesis C-methylase UbiE
MTATSVASKQQNLDASFALPAEIDDATARVRRLCDQAADKYDREIRVWERLLFADGRQWLCNHASGDVLEIAIGTGRDLAFYPGSIRLTGVDLSPRMLAIAEARARSLGLDVDLQVGDAQSLPFPDDRFDTVVAALAICMIPAPRRAIAEVHRVLRPGGRFRLLEHVRSPLLPVRLVQRALNPLTVRFEGDHLMRDPLDYIADAGFTIEECARSKWGIVERLVVQKAP